MCGGIASYKLGIALGGGIGGALYQPRRGGLIGASAARQRGVGLGAAAHQRGGEISALIGGSSCVAWRRGGGVVK